MEDRLDKNIFISKRKEKTTSAVHPLLVRLTETNPITPVCICVPLVMVFSYLALKHISIINFLLCFVLGLFLWTFIEYAMHRFLYHHHAHEKNKIGKIFLLLTHGLHHESPQDKTRLASIPLLTSFDAFIVCVLYYFIFGSHYDAIFSGTLLGYLIYDLVHYEVHVSNNKNKLFQYLKRYHFSHHFLDNTKGFGVTTPLWDYVFRTKAALLSSKQKLSAPK